MGICKEVGNSTAVASAEAQARPAKQGERLSEARAWVSNEVGDEYAVGWRLYFR